MPADTRRKRRLPGPHGHCLHGGEVITEAMGRRDAKESVSLDDGYCKCREPSEET